MKLSPTLRLATLAVFCRFKVGTNTGKLMVLTQRAVAGQVLSPPPDTVAVFTTVAPGVTPLAVMGITKVRLPTLACNTVLLVQVMVLAAKLQPAGRVPTVKPAGTGSLMLMAANVGPVPVLVTVKV